ncbi:protein HYPER-SENSITIVITY-RELATED 4-like protein [Cinnamomum micranthum f. kanehirae]|uniref:Protein HYPER-SENSITIVITY-RELATED 4-like protein n=1 Tax=Cinnamomum micranthum f. kanehirae TaxID=337451 RepID=A0A443NVA6_9MAGN|nr:protein HYPER-SENSITIVITY-RELATED 4-like protein [Cinnamomum micranthum f. kanehirae]
MASAKSVLATAASLSASVVLIRTIVNDLIPRNFQNYIFSTLHTLFHRLSSQLTIIIDKYEGFAPNQLYEAIKVYLGSKIFPPTRRLKVSKSNKENNLKVSIGTNEEVVDTFQGIQIKWRWVFHEVQRAVIRRPHDLYPTFQTQFSYFQLSFHKKHKDKVMGSYFQHVLSEAKVIKEELKTLKLHTLQHMHMNPAGMWMSVNLMHPATFETLAMDPELKRAIMEDLKRFVERRESYRTAGRAWKRGYLLYGPPGTGKSSLIAAMANFLKFDVYDLELTDIGCNSDFRKLLLGTANRSIVVIEDIDCTAELGKRRRRRGGLRSVGTRKDNQVTLSGLLNFVDGLWSSCGDERIIIFTTNHKDRLDPALLRPGRMDMHIHMSYLKSNAFNILSSNYLGIDDHKFFKEISQLLEKVEVTPAQVAEELMKSNDPDVALRGLIQFLKEKGREDDETYENNEQNWEKGKMTELGDRGQMGQRIGEEIEENVTI